jgi:hypothetical protein
MKGKQLMCLSNRLMNPDGKENGCNEAENCHYEKYGLNSLPHGGVKLNCCHTCSEAVETQDLASLPSLQHGAAGKTNQSVILAKQTSLYYSVHFNHIRI